MFNEFCNEMLAKFDSKADTLGNNWKDCSYNALHRLFAKHISKYLDIYWKAEIGIKHGSNEEAIQVQESLIDIANYCCMLYTKLERYKNKE